MAVEPTQQGAFHNRVIALFQQLFGPLNLLKIKAKQVIHHDLGTQCIGLTALIALAVLNPAWARQVPRYYVKLTPSIKFALIRRSILWIVPIRGSWG